MGSFSLFHWLLFGGVAILVLGGGRFSNMMGDVAKGIKQFKKGMAEEETPQPAERAQMIEGRTAADIIAEHEANKAASVAKDGV